MIIGFGNNVVSSLAADITAGQTTIQVMPGAGAIFAGLLSQDYTNSSNTPKIYAKITLTDAKETVFEVCHLTAVNNDTLTVVRGQEGTTAKGWSLNDVIANFATRGSENQFVQIEQLQSGHYTSGVAGGTANALTINLPATYFVNGSTDWVLRTPLVIYPSLNNTGASTLQLTMGGKVLGTYKLYKGNKAELVANDILKDVALVCLMDKTRTFFTILNPGGIYSSFVPINRKVNGHELSKDVDVLPGDIFKLATAIGNAADLNDYTAPGLYYQPLNAQAQTGKNYPETNAGSLEVYKHAGFTQIYRIYNSSRAYIRTLYSGTWSAWTKQYDAANKPTAGDVGALPITGGTVTGNAAVNGTLSVGNGRKFEISSQNSSTSNGTLLLWGNADRPTVFEFKDATGYHYYSQRNKDGSVSFSFNGVSSFGGGVSSSGEFISRSANGFRIAYGNYGAFWRNDGASLYLLVTNSGDPLGTFNSLRPFTVALATGYVTMGRLTLTDYASFDARYYTQSAANAKFVTQTRLGSVTSTGQIGNSNLNYGNGIVLTGIYGSANYTVNLTIYYRAMQYLINGTWYTATSA